jgi:hypothetical protein
VQHAWWRCIQFFLSENEKGRDHSEDLDVNGKIILKWILNRVGRLLRIETIGGLCEYGSKSSGSIKGGKFLDYQRDGLFLKDRVPWSE